MRKNDRSKQMQQAVTGLEDNYSGKTLMLNGVLWKSVDLVKLFQNQITLMAATETSHETWLANSKKEKAEDGPAQEALTALRAYVALQFGSSSEQYRAFGFGVPQTRAKPTTPTRSTALAQSQATRKARNTMGKKQRLAIKGVVQPQVSAPAVTSPSAPSATPTAASGTTPNGVNSQAK